MKSSLIRPALALALAASLSACGGSDKAEFTVAGTVTGVVYEGMVLSTNGMEIKIAPPAKAGDPVSFAFPNKLEYGDVYNVQITKEPEHQNCGTPQNVIPNFNDTAGRLAEINVSFACDLENHALYGTITGLTADGLVLANGSNTGTLTVAKPASTTPFRYDMPNVPYGVSYSVSVIKQPTGQVCTVANATGIMGDADVGNVDVTCVAAP